MNKILTTGVAVFAIAAVVGLGGMSVSAMHGQNNGSGGESHGVMQRSRNGAGKEASLQSRAEVFGMTAEELSTALETKTMSQIAVERGMSEEDFRAKMTEAAKARWEARGLDAEQIAERVAEREQRHEERSEDCEFGSGEGQRLGGHGRNR
jgi:hypothetical protein